MQLQPWQLKRLYHLLTAFAAPQVRAAQVSALVWQRQVFQASSRGSWTNSVEGHYGAWALPVSGFEGLDAHQSAASARRARWSHPLKQVPKLIAGDQA